MSVKWHSIESDMKYRMFSGLMFKDCWFVVGGEVHKGHGNGKMFWSEDDEYSYRDNDVSHFAKRVPEKYPRFPQ